MEAIRVQQIVQKNGEIIIKDLPVVAGQQVEVLLLLTPTVSKPEQPRMTAKDLLNSELVGLWADRTDITDSAAYARHLREQAQRRSDINGLDDDHPG